MTKRLQRFKEALPATLKHMTARGVIESFKIANGMVTVKLRPAGANRFSQWLRRFFGKRPGDKRA
jgi:hypothetical protein